MVVFLTTFIANWNILAFRGLVHDVWSNDLTLTYARLIATVFMYILEKAVRTLKLLNV